jgi:hypothetical protein
VAESPHNGIDMGERGGYSLGVTAVIGVYVLAHCESACELP